MIGICNDCKKERKLVARGFCGGCYKKFRKSKEFEFLDLTKRDIGKRYGRLVVTGVTEKRAKNKGYIVTCKCDCGNTFVTELRYLKDGGTTSCGCYQKECAKKSHDQNIKFDEEHGYFQNTCVHHLKSKISSANTSGVKGVSFSKKYQKWETYISIKGKRYHLGMFKNLDDARKARELAEEKYFNPVLKDFDDFIKSTKEQNKG